MHYPLWDLFNTWLTRTTFQGFPRCRNEKLMGSLYRRTVWLILSLSCLGYSVWLLKLTVDDFLNMPSIVSIEVQSSPTIDFPTVTFCPVQALREVSAEQYTTWFSLHNYFVSIGQSKWGQKPPWSTLMQRMKDEDKKLDKLMEVTQMLLNQFEGKNEISKDAILEKIISNNVSLFRDNAYVQAVRGLQRFSQSLLYRMENRSIWTPENIAGAGAAVNWINETWNGKYFDTRMHDHSISLGNLSETVMQNDYAEMVFTKAVGNLRASIDLWFENSNFTKEWKPFDDLTRKFNKHYGHGKLYYSDEHNRKYNGQRFMYPYAFGLVDVVWLGTFNSKTIPTNDIFSTIHPVWKTCFHYNNEYVNQLNEGEIFYQLNTTNKTMTSKQVRMTGREAGLSLQLFSRTNATRYPLLNPINGYIVSIGNPATMPNLDKHILVPNIGTTDLVIQRSGISRLDESQGGDCAHANHFLQIFPSYQIIGEYDQSICQNLQSFISVFEECECVMSSNVMGGIINIEKLVRQNELCSLDAIPCIDYATELASNKSGNCPPACREVMYDVRFYSAPYNTYGSGSTAKLHSIGDLFSSACYNDGDSVCRTLKLSTMNIFYRTMNVKVLTEELMYTPNIFVGNIGSVIGLYLGMSLMSVMDIFELVFDVLRLILIAVFCGKRRTSPSDSPVKEIHHHLKCRQRIDALIKKNLELEKQKDAISRSLKE